MKKIALLLLILTSYCMLNGQTATKGWEVFYTGDSGGDDRMEDLLIDNNHIITVGRLYKGDDETVVLTKHTLTGQQVWGKTWFIDGLDLYPYFIQKGANGNYYIIGYADSGEYFIVQFDTNGNYVNVTVLPVATFTDFRALPDGSFILAGGDNDKPYLWKFDQNLQLIWEKQIPLSFSQGTYGAELYSVDAAPDGSLYLLTRGTSIITNTSSDDVIVAKTDAQGNLLWNKVFGGTKGDYLADSYDNQVRSRIMAHPDGGFVFECNTRSLEFAPAGVTTLTELLVIKGDANGNQQWWSTSNGGAAYGNGLAIKPNGNILVFGKGKTGNTSPFYSATDLSDRAYILELKNLNGQKVWGASFGGEYSDFTRGLTVLDNTKLFAGGSNDERAWLFSVNISGVSSTTETTKLESLAVFPNPTTHQITISLEPGFSGQARVYDLRGKLVLEANLESSTDETQLNVEGLPKGCYELLLFNQNGTTKTGKFVRS